MTEIRGVSLQERKKILGRDVKQYTVIKKKPLYFLHTNIRLLNSDAVLQKSIQLNTLGFVSDSTL